MLNLNEEDVKRFKTQYIQKTIKDVSEAYVRRLHEDFKDPENRGKNFTWKRFPKMVSRLASCECFLYFKNWDTFSDDLQKAIKKEIGNIALQLAKNAVNASGDTELKEKAMYGALTKEKVLKKLKSLNWVNTSAWNRSNTFSAFVSAEEWNKRAAYPNPYNKENVKIAEIDREHFSVRLLESGSEFLTYVHLDLEVHRMLFEYLSTSLCNKCFSYPKIFIFCPKS